MATALKGFECYTDFGNPCAITAIANTTISGGALVAVSGIANAAGSLADTFTDSEMVAIDASGVAFTGVAMHNTGSNTKLAIATRGAYVMTAAGTVLAGQIVAAIGDHGVIPVTTGSVANTQYPIGRALSAAGSEGYVIVRLGL
jgi:hypothetical protein